MRALVRLVTAAAVTLTAVLVPVLGGTPGSTAQAANTALFDAGNIIADAVFFDGLAMDAGAVQNFLDAKGASCTGGEMPCLKKYRQDTATQVPDAYCAGYQGAYQESAAAIIAKVGASCGINPRVLLVLLQKEQSLVTTKTPTVYAYDHATGFACPDTAPCNPAFTGFVSQVYFAARQFERYRIDAKSFRYKAGRVNTIQWHPDINCGTSDVYLANQATAELYNYTPYRPNQAALAAGYAAVAKTDPAAGCASYGNRNFWNYFTDWFGSTQSSGASAILDAYNAMGASDSWLGTATSGYICGLVNGGCFQRFQGGSLYWSPATGAHPVRGAIGGLWGNQNWEKGWLGYPTSDELCGLAQGGCAQNFQGASVYYTPATGAVPVGSPIYSGFAAQGYENGVFGYPVGWQTCGLANGGCYQAFQGGTVYYSPATGSHMVRGAIFATWANQRYETGRLGYPTTEESCTVGMTGAVGCWQTYQGGTLAWSSATGTQQLTGTIAGAWLAAGGPASSAGNPVGGQICGLVRGGCYQGFQGGTVYSGPPGVHMVRGAIFGIWGSRGYEAGALGYPVSEETCSSSGCTQSFEKSTIVWSPSAAPQYVGGAIGYHWLQAGALGNVVGMPVGPEICGLVNGGCYQGFTNGTTYYSPATGAFDVIGLLRDAWAQQGFEVGPLGYPVEDARAVPGGFSQRFQGGTLTLTTATGVVARS
jgi:uncharacterized protein with LGFP repeats